MFVKKLFIYFTYAYLKKKLKLVMIVKILNQNMSPIEKTV